MDQPSGLFHREERPEEEALGEQRDLSAWRGHRAGPRISRNSEKEPEIETAAATKQLWSLQNYYFLPHLLFCICSSHAADDCLKIVLLYSNDS